MYSITPNAMTIALLSSIPTMTHSDTSPIMLGHSY